MNAPALPPAGDLLTVTTTGVTFLEVSLPLTPGGVRQLRAADRTPARAQA